MAIPLLDRGPKTILAALAGGALVLVALLLPPRARSIDACPEGTALTRAEAPSGAQQWCERPGADGGRVKDGLYVAWHPNGRTKIDGAYRDGTKEGRWTFWHLNGRKREEGEFREGREHGAWMRWYANGHSLEAGGYRDGTRQGRWAFWYENGQKDREGEYRDGLEVGPWTRWNLKGEPCGAAPAG